MAIASKRVHKFKRRLLIALISRAARSRWLRSSKALAKLFVATLNESNRGSDHESVDKKWTVLVLTKPGINEDAKTVFESDTRFSTVYAPTGLMKAIAKGFLPQELDDNYYVSSSKTVGALKQSYREFLIEFLRHVLKIRRLDAIVSGNFAYFAERELQAAAEQIGLPFIILHKENLKSPARQTYYENVYRTRRGPFEGRHIIVYNEFEREVQLAAGVAPPRRISICGMPRLDRAHAWRKANAGRTLSKDPSVVFFAFGEKTGLPIIRRKMSGGFVETLDGSEARLSWKGVVNGTFRGVLEFTARNSCVQVFLKSKRGRIELDSDEGGYVKKDCSALNNVTLIEGGDPFELLKEAWCVVGMNTTAILEALAMGKSVLVPAFAEAADKEMQPWLAQFGESVRYMRSSDQLAETLERICGRDAPIVPRVLTRNVMETLETWAGNSDGRASERVRACLMNELEPSAGYGTIGMREHNPDYIESPDNGVERMSER